jgi:two-component system, LytTR family, sensor kinase
MKTQSSKKKFWWFYHLGIVLFSALSAMLMKYNQVGNAFDPTALAVFLTILVTSLGVGYIAIFMVNKAARYTRKELTRRILPALLIFYVTAFVIANLAISVSVFGWFLYTGRNLAEFIPQLFQRELTFSRTGFFAWLLSFTIAFFYVLWNKSVKQEQLLAEENLKFRYNNLKAHVNPHFLFNSLNTLSELVYINAQKADRYIQQLAAIYRYLLDNEDTDFIPLTEELTFVQQYFSLQQERDKGKITLQIDCPNAGRFQIIPVSLQLLVENALKHNAISGKNPLKISIYEGDNCVVVSNPVQRKNVMENSTKTGLSNLKERVKLMMHSEVLINEDQYLFEAKIPVIPL